MSELNRCRDKLDFWQYVAAILAMAIMLLSAMLYFCRTVHTNGFVDVGGSNFIYRVGRTPAQLEILP